MAKAVHITKHDQGWAVKRDGRKRATSVHRTQAEARASARRLALESGGAEVVVHRADGGIRDRDTVGSTKIDESKVETRPSSESGKSSRPREQSRAPRSEGPRTTLRLPGPLAELAEQLADELRISRNDAVLRLATQGAKIYAETRAIQATRELRWAAVVPGIIDIEQADFPPPDEARSAVLESREERLDTTDA